MGFLLVSFKVKKQLVAKLPFSVSKESLMMVTVLCNAPEESLNSKDNVICAIIPAWTVVEVNPTNALLVEQVRKISSCSFFCFLGLEVPFSLSFQGQLLEQIK